MNLFLKKSNGDRRIYGKLSILAPIVGVGSLMLIIFYFSLSAKDSEGQLWGRVIGIVIGGLILFGSTIFGLGLALASRKKENCRLLSLIGFILNTVLFVWILYILIPLFLGFFIK